MRTAPVRFTLACTLLCLIAPSSAQADDLDPKSIFASIGFTAEETAKARAGGIIHRSLDASNERELVAAMAFIVPGTPSDLVARARGGISTKVDPNTISWGTFDGPATAASLSKLALDPDGEKRAKRYRSAEPGDDLNLSREEIAAFAALGDGASKSAVEPVLRKTLAARVESYRAKGLDGIAPYARSKSGERSVSADLRSATEALDRLAKRVPGTVAFLGDYPKGRPEGTEEVFEWSQLSAHGVPTLVLTHRVYVPEGAAWVVMQRQYYVSEGYNCEQAVAVFLPVEDGTAVIYVNRTSTDQVTGFGGGAKRSIGSKMLASQLEALFKDIRKEAGK